MESMNRDGLHDRVQGVLWGLAAGDRNGGPIQMAVRLAESLAEVGRYKLEDVAERYLDWWREGAFDTGPTTAAVMQLLDEGVELDKATAQVHRDSKGKTAGCNPAHRAAPLAMAATLTDDLLPRWAALEAAVTHWDPLAGEVAAGVVVLCRLLIRGLPWEEAQHQSGFGRRFVVEQALQATTPRDKLNAGGFAPDVLAAASFFLHHADDFTQALHASIDFAGGANYCPVLVGAIGGARWGAQAIPPEALTHVSEALSTRIQHAADSLATRWPDNTLQA